MAETIEVLAEHADRSMRTSAARSIARRIHQALAPFPSADAFLESLATAPSWARVDDTRYACAFGGRSVTIAVPTPFHAHAMLRLVVRTEINVCLGDCDPVLLAALHSLAQRELQQLIES